MSEPLPIDQQLTKDGIAVRAGQVWRDLDKRMSGRKCLVVRLEDGKAIMANEGDRDGKRRTRVSVLRMHKHSTGWELVHDFP